MDDMMLNGEKNLNLKLTFLISVIEDNDLFQDGEHVSSHRYFGWATTDDLVSWQGADIDTSVQMQMV